MEPVIGFRQPARAGYRAVVPRPPDHLGSEGADQGFLRGRLQSRDRRTQHRVVALECPVTGSDDHLVGQTLPLGRLRLVRPPYGKVADVEPEEVEPRWGLVVRV